jgi:hypothetical protein
MIACAMRELSYLAPPRIAARQLARDQYIATLPMSSPRTTRKVAPSAPPALAGIGVLNEQTGLRIVAGSNNAPSVVLRRAVRGDPRSAGFIPREELHRHANPHRPPPCIPQVALPREVAAMNTPYPTYPRLHALLGAALPGLQLSNAAAEALEDALAEANEHAPPSAFFARLRGIAHSHAADGQAWRERQLSEARGRDWPRRRAAWRQCLRAGVLLAAQSAREMDDAQAQCPPQVEEGLLHAVVVLADHAGALVEPDACAPLL